MARQFFSGNTIEQALLSAGSHYDLDPEQILYKVRDKKHGFLKGRRRVVIEVDPSSPEKTEEVSAEAVDAPIEEVQEKPVEKKDSRRPEPPSRHKKPSRDFSRQRGSHRRNHSRREPEPEWFGVSFEEDKEAIADSQNPEIGAFERAVDSIAEFLDVETECKVTQQEDLYLVEIFGEDCDILLEENGEGLRAIEHLLPRLVRGLLGRGLPCRVDCNGFQAARDAELRGLAEEVAKSVREEGRSAILDPMTPADRRIVHMTLAEDPTVETESEGSGFMKRVMVVPV